MRLKLGVAVLLALGVQGDALAKGGKNKQHKFVGGHPLSARADDGYCFIQVPHVHKSAPPPKHTALYRDHRGHSHFVADPSPYGYDEERHAYYGHHPVAIEVVVGEEARYESGQALEFCYLDGPHYHVYEPQPGLTFELKGGVSWYIGDLPSAYVEGKPRYRVGNRVYATIDVPRPVVEIEAPPVGYVGPVLDIHVHGGGPGHGGAHVHGEVGIGVHVDVPDVEIGIGLPGIVVHDGRDNGHSHHKKHRKHKKVKKGKGRRRIRF